LRIVGGRLRGKRLQGPSEERSVRPTSDRLREALFNILAHGPFGGADGPAPTGMAVLDVFAGTGAVGLEALSRGARLAAFLENDPAALDLVRRNLRACGLEASALVLPRDATRPGRPPHAFDLAYLDPPYGAGLAGPTLAALAAGGWLAPDATVAVELGRREAFAPPAGFAVVDERGYGAARLLLLRRPGTG